MNITTDAKRKESKTEVQTYLDRLGYALNGGYAKVSFQSVRSYSIDLLRKMLAEWDFKENDFPYKKV